MSVQALGHQENNEMKPVPKPCEEALSCSVGLLLLGIECNAMVGRTRKAGIGEVTSTLATSLHKPETVCFDFSRVTPLCLSNIGTNTSNREIRSRLARMASSWPVGQGPDPQHR